MIVHPACAKVGHRQAPYLRPFYMISVEGAFAFVKLKNLIIKGKFKIHYIPNPPQSIFNLTWYLRNTQKTRPYVLYSNFLHFQYS